MTRPAPTVTDNPSALVSVPVAVIAACKGEQEHFEGWAKSSRYDMSEHPLHYIFLDPKTDAARMGWNAALAYVRDNAAAPAAPQAAGVGELVGQIDALLAIPDENLSTRVPHLARELLERAASHLRAPSREPEGGAVDGPWAWLTAYVEDDGDPADREYNCDDMVAAWRAGYATLATREEAPAPCKPCNGSGMDAGSRFNRCPDCREEAPASTSPAEAGSGGHPASVLASQGDRS